MKKLRDHLLCRALELCMEHDVPMQIHTGMGDFEVNLVLCRPGLPDGPAPLPGLSRLPGAPRPHRLSRTIARPPTWPTCCRGSICDISEGIPFAGDGGREIMRGVLAMAPLNKICYGSDGYKVPEIIYTSAKLGKQALAPVLAELVADGMLAEGDAQAAAGIILAGNARELYGLD